ncbi:MULTISPECIES: bifunctional phosphopantothenoylcysteine decarboxylase/phosphopantothenate--cysteine ligase CoaBC [Lysinibacillus]|jgi:phosphopantothenoylcysteine decarboxylase/phosphopantothenate--cysteine ligase|uniref:Bifunctional phosphopantothenoylcysteine decarboxylase/phosphopantothenate--cysteine ligase CoaBC n=2 Tax=Lysinibacillus TaxID=400634 RepID=A0A2I0V4X4_9BACI|nr:MULTISPECIES: bifunctional phosphopantothenoylcysteine decarboxylase/phosphopantothenate--cysteine ligase CoaBC [Lysinibacillus]KUF36409.1 CoA biosynthesis protein CoaBC [Lysinibacillus sp. F5]MEE3806955.1 bifunctional phosphopantothenoylcysteine decarboxylase/phosphopantothenate--cysteine ligase CoaBC [Lysinibacillus fusiformis]PKU53328.1 bifunctional phosphopantothenoylcysteine decarboxylase/phosphopantothenate--cysteine ligase CoaBC [Lysinibacillus fusiformis]SCX81530.1 phosphopantothenoy
MNKNILLCVSGGIAVYKAVALVSKLSQAGANVKVMMTASARQFVNPLSFQVMSKNDVYFDTFDEKDSSVIAHIDLADWADLILVAPATANMIGKLANGIADDMVTTTLLATTAPVWIAPAMNVHMYDHPAVKRNLDRLSADGYQFIEPSEGFLACGYVGKGRLEEPEKITALVKTFFSGQSKPLKGKTVIVTAGALQVPLDEKHMISPQASGIIGRALANEARIRGAHVIEIENSNLYDVIQQLEAYKIQYPQAFFIHAANVPTIDETPIISVEGTNAITFGQQVQGKPMINILSDSWIDFSENAQLNGQFLATTNPQLFAQTLWSHITKDEVQ